MNKKSFVITIQGRRNTQTIDGDTGRRRSATSVDDGASLLLPAQEAQGQQGTSFVLQHGAGLLE